MGLILPKIPCEADFKTSKCPEAVRENTNQTNPFDVTPFASFALEKQGGPF